MEVFGVAVAVCVYVVGSLVAMAVAVTGGGDRGFGAIFTLTYSWFGYDRWRWCRGGGDHSVDIRYVVCF